jgi:putative two-component system response regulator
MAPEELRSFAKILIVDDDEEAQALYRSILAAEGYVNIRTALDPRGVLALFVEYDPDILILDIMMPHLDGIELLSILQKSVSEGLSFPVLVVTGFPSAEKRYQAFESGAVDVLAKPFDYREFVLRVNNLLKIRISVNDMMVQGMRYLRS